MTAYTLQLPDETLSKLDLLAKKLDRSPASVVAQAIGVPRRRADQFRDCGACRLSGDGPRRARERHA